MSIIRAIKNYITAKDKGLGARKALSVFFIFLYIQISVIPSVNSSLVWWIIPAFGICVAVVWRIGRTYMRVVIATLLLALTIVMVFGFTGPQQTSDAGRIVGWSQNRGYKMSILLTHQGGMRIIEAHVTKADLYRFEPWDDVVCKYRTVSLFGHHLWTAIDSVESAPVLGLGSRNAYSDSYSWLMLLMGAAPLGYMIVAIRRRRRGHGGVPSNVATIGDEDHESTAAFNKSV